MEQDPKHWVPRPLRSAIQGATVRCQVRSKPPHTLPYIITAHELHSVHGLAQRSTTAQRGSAEHWKGPSPVHALLQGSRSQLWLLLFHVQSPSWRAAPPVMVAPLPQVAAVRPVQAARRGGGTGVGVGGQGGGNWDVGNVGKGKGVLPRQTATG
jgi:hypothetical protein